MLSFFHNKKSFPRIEPQPLILASQAQLLSREIHGGAFIAKKQNDILWNKIIMPFLLCMLVVMVLIAKRSRAFCFCKASLSPTLSTYERWREREGFTNET